MWSKIFRLRRLWNEYNHIIYRKLGINPEKVQLSSSTTRWNVLLQFRTVQMIIFENQFSMMLSWINLEQMDLETKDGDRNGWSDVPVHHGTGKRTVQYRQRFRWRYTATKRPIAAADTLISSPKQSNKYKWSWSHWKMQRNNTPTSMAGCTTVNAAHVIQDASPGGLRLSCWLDWSFGYIKMILKAQKNAQES